jgi:hypothetical protein
MPRDHGRILVTIWDDPDFVDLTPEAQRLYMLLLSQRGINNAGMLPTQIGKWAKRSRHTTVADIEAALEELIDTRFVLCDGDTEETLVRSFVRNDGITKNANVFKNALACAEAIESPFLRAALADELRRLGRGDATEVADRMSPVGTAENERTGTPFERRSDAVPTPAGKGKGKGLSHLLDNSSFSDDARERRQPKRKPAAPADPLDKPGPIVPIDGRKLVRSVIPDTEPSAVRTELALQAAAMLRQQPPIPSEDIRAGLELWLTKPDLGPRTLPSLVSTIQRGRNRSNAAPVAAPREAASDRKRREQHAVFEQLRAEAIAQQRGALQSPLVQIIDADPEWSASA